jgi:SPIRAL1-like protein
MNDNQNYFVTRSTSRVLAQPGGDCSIDIFGGAPTAKSKADDAASSDASKASINATPAPDASKASTSKEPTPKMDEVARNRQRAMGDSFDLFGGEPAKPSASAADKISSNRYASASSTNSYNVITDRPTSRVLQPPGGKCSDIFG